MPVYNMFKKSDTDHPVKTDDIPKQPTPVNPFGAALASGKKAVASKAGRKQQRQQRTDASTPKKEVQNERIRHYRLLVVHQNWL